MVDHIVVCAEKSRYRAGKHQSDGSKNNAEYDGEHYQHGKIAVRFVFVALAKCFRDESGAARAYHEPRSADYHDKRPYDVYRGERGITDEIGYEKSVYDAVNRRTDHHYYRRQNEFVKPSVSEMIG